MSREAFSDTVLRNLHASGLSDSNIALMRISQITQERSGKTILGYRIPFFNFDGAPINFYRDRWLWDDPKQEPRYIQAKTAANHIYIPPNFASVFAKNPSCVLFTEGEKKAAKACQEGFPCLGLTGVDSWRTHTFNLKGVQVLESTKEVTTIKASKDTISNMVEDHVVKELLDCVQLFQKTRIVLCYDRDVKATTTENVQRAQFDLAMWFVEQGIENVEQLQLPLLEGFAKIGLDDFLVHKGVEAFRDQLALTWKFPVHPTIKSWLARKLDTRNVVRTDFLTMARAVISELDAAGSRYTDGLGNFYFFDNATKVLHSFRWDATEIRQFRLSSFGQYIADKFGIGTTDANFLGRIADAFIATPGLRTVTPHRVSYATELTAYYQLSDSRAIRITPTNIEFVDNGTDGVLFLSGCVENLDELEIRDALRESLQRKQQYSNRGLQPPRARWLKILEKSHIQPIFGLTLEQTRVAIAALWYLSPWLRRWKPPQATVGLMLPLELTIAEPNSGKSFLYNFRMGIITGKSTLSNTPIDIKSWFASLVSSNGMWVGDNVGSLDSQLRSQLSDELCRLITDPDPAVELRRLYTTAENVRYAIDCTFAITAVNNPFTREDLLQRSFVLNLQAIPVGERDGNFYSRQLGMGGRARWIVDHIEKLQAFFVLASTRWVPDRLSNHRLAHFEQALLLMGEVLGQSDDMAVVITNLTKATQENIATYNPVLEALRSFVAAWKDNSNNVRNGQYRLFTASDICEWATGEGEDEFKSVVVLRNSRQLGKYMASHASDIELSCGIQKTDKNRQGKTLFGVI